MKLENFEVLDFPKDSDAFNTLTHLKKTSAVYVIFFVKGDIEKPLYIGETDSMYDRIGDYWTAHPKANTDFTVGEAIKCLRDENGYEIRIRYKTLIGKSARKKEERAIRKHFLSEGYRLLNNWGYDYKKDNKTEEKELIRKFCSVLQ